MEKDWNLLSAEEKDELSLVMLCKRLLDIDRKCNSEKGCPATFAAFPMILHWREGNSFVEFEYRKNLEVIRQMLGADGQGRACEIDEIQFLAREFLNKR